MSSAVSSTTEQNTFSLDTIVALCKRRGFVYQSGDIYGGLNGVYDFGPLGTLLRKNIKKAWLSSLEATGFSIVELDGALLGLPAEWEASGHLKNFHDPMVDCLVCKHRYRADDINLEKPCPHCGNTKWTGVRQFNLMFKTAVGAAEDASATAYLRPETAQAVFVNFKNVISTTRVKVPFGIAQIGKAFRNEITPKQFLFRLREFEQMELEWFCKASESVAFFEQWKKLRFAFYRAIGFSEHVIRLRPHEKDELAHYSTMCTDVEYAFPFGWKELEGIAHRGEFDLTQHTSFSGKELAVFDEETKTSYVPTVVECSVGVDRLMLALLCNAYKQDIVEGEERIVLQFAPAIAPITAAFLPLSKKLEEPAYKIYERIKKLGYSVQFDDTGSIGKRYRRQDEIGTPACFTYDFDSETTNTVTVRNRDTTAQERIAIDKIEEYLKNLLQ